MRVMTISGLFVLLVLLVAMLSAPAVSYAGGLFTGALGAAELKDLRAGDGTTEIIAESMQTVTGTSGDTITAGSVTSGNITVSDDAFGNARGMINFIANSAPNAVVQGTMSLIVILNN